MSDKTELLPCPFCGGEAEMLTAESMHGGNLYGVMCANCAGRSDVYDTEAEAIAAWNSREEYHGYEQAAIEAWENIKAWNARATHGTLTADQVRDAIRKYAHDDSCYIFEVYGEMCGLIADELNAMLESDAKPCYAADENYKRCKYSVNRGWCDDAPFLVWDDTGHLFITMGGLKTWDVTGDAKKWFAELGSGTCEWLYPQGVAGWLGYAECSNCGYRVYENTIDEREWTYCPNCGAKAEVHA